MDNNDAVCLINISQVRRFDEHLDTNCGISYLDQPLAQDWARVAKVAEEAGEAVQALIGLTAQNPRKGYYATLGDLLGELADVAFTAIYAIQHFTKDTAQTEKILAEHEAKVRRSLEAFNGVL